MARILYIEDNPDNRLLVQRVLMASDYNFEVEVTDNAIEGIKMAEADPPDLILMDMSMPDMDGLTATQKIRSTPAIKNMLIVALTANVMEGDRERTLNAGCDGYISKPIDVDKLPEEVNSYLRSRDERGAEHETAHAD
jgi:two-component system cell cycle response regulator DivK